MQMDDAWDIHFAMGQLRKAAMADAIDPAIERVKASLIPVPGRWLLDRLSVLAKAGALGRTSADSLTAWLEQTVRLLADLPGDLCDYAIDEAVKQSTRGFTPTAGEIRAHALPLLRRRRRDLHRLEALARYRPPAGERRDQITPQQVGEVLEAHGFGAIAKRLRGEVDNPEAAP